LERLANTPDSKVHNQLLPHNNSKPSIPKR
jgi:hypothetical protein